MANITLLGASYTDVPAVTLPKTGGGTESFYDLSSDTVTSADHIMSGYIGHLADGSQVTGTGSGGSSSGQTKTGTVTGDGTTTLQIPCSFKPDLIYVYGDMSGAVSNRGVTSVTIIKDELIDIHSDTSSSADSESLIYVSHDVTGYNENDSSNPHASYSNGTLTIDMVSNSTSTKFRSGQVYTYELSTVGTGSGGSANLGTKTITVNGTYDAGDDSLDGYSEVTVNVPDPADYTSASTALGISKPITSGIEALTTYANGVTGESDTNLSDAVYSLAQGFGHGGPLTLIGTKTFDDVPEYTDTSSWEAVHDTDINIKNTDYAFGLVVITCDSAITTNTEWGMTVSPFGRYTTNGNIFCGQPYQQKGSSTLSKTQMVNGTISQGAYGVTVLNNESTVKFKRMCHGSAMPKIRGGTYTVKVYALTSF